MNITMRPVTVHQIPEQVSASDERKFLRELQDFVERDRPRLVLDCSRIRRMDNNMMHLLLSCLEEVMKRNGDVKLASLPAGAEGALQTMGVSRLFETYSTTAEAMHSYHQRLAGISPAVFATEEFDRESETAA